MTDITPAPDDRRAPIALWRAARAFLVVLHALFGGPEDVAFQHTFTGKDHSLLAGWLRCAEAMLRRLLLIEAASYPKPNTRPLLSPTRQRVRRKVEFWPDKPQDWRVTFRAFLGDTHARRQARQDGRALQGACVSPKKRISREDRWSFENFKPVTFRDAWPLAERYEALLRVFNDPAPYARRLARRLHATPHRHVEGLRTSPEARHRIDCFEDLTEQASAAWRERRSSA